LDPDRIRIQSTAIDELEGAGAGMSGEKMCAACPPSGPARLPARPTYPSGPSAMGKSIRIF